MLIKNVFYKELVSNAARILIVLVIILPVTELFKLLDQASSGQIPLVTLLTLMLYGTLASFPMILNIACFLTILITFNRYSKDHELTIWFASGISPFYWLKQVALFITPLMLICGICSMVITPWAMHKSQEYAVFLSKQKASMALSPGLFKELQDGKQVFYIENYSLANGYAKNIFMEYTDDSQTTYNVTAKEGKLINNNGLMNLILIDGNRYQLNNAQNDTVNLEFKEMRAGIPQSYDPQKDKVGLGNSTYPITTLIHLLDDSHSRAEFSWRISIAIMTMAMALIAVPLSMQTSRVQSNLIFIFPPILYAIYQNIVLTINGYIGDNVLKSIWYVIPIHLVIIGAAILLTYFKTKPHGYFRSKNK